jgi:MerR HTH family regulatory protein
MDAGYAPRRPATTRGFRRIPLGWTAPQVAEIAGIPVRTVQHWRTRGIFVSAFPLGVDEGHKPGELYALGDVVALRFFRDLLDLGVDPELAAAIAREAQVLTPGPEVEFFAYRKIALLDPPWWFFFPAVEQLAEGKPDGDLLRVWEEPTLATRGFLSHDRPSTQPVPWESESEPLAYWYPISAIASDIISKADNWRRRHRVSIRDWPPWM